MYDDELSMLGKVDLVGLRSDGGFQQQKLPVRRGGGRRGRGGDDDDVEEATSSSFWTVCPYCYNLYEYARVYEDCCLRCQNYQKAFHGVTIPTLLPLVVGREAYHCCWSFFLVPSAISNSQGVKKAAVTVIDRQPQPQLRSVFSKGGFVGGGFSGEPKGGGCTVVMGFGGELGNGEDPVGGGNRLVSYGGDGVTPVVVARVVMEVHGGGDGEMD